MALAPPRDRFEAARTRALRRSIRARVVAAVSIAAVSWWTHAAFAGTQQFVARGPVAEGATGPRAAQVVADVRDAEAREARPLGVAGSGSAGSVAGAAGAAGAPTNGAAGEQASSAAKSGGVMDVVRTGAALVVVIGLIGAAWWWLRRAGVGGHLRGGAFEVISRHPMGRGQQIMVVRFGPRVLCVQQTRDGLRTLCELSDAAEIAALTAQLQGGGGGSFARTRSEPIADEAIRTVDVRGRHDS